MIGIRDQSTDQSTDSFELLQTDGRTDGLTDNPQDQGDRPDDMTHDARTDPDFSDPRGILTMTTTLRGLDHIDGIRARLAPQRLAARGATAEGLTGTRVWVDGRPCMVYPVPTDAPAVVAEGVRIARRAAAAVAAVRATRMRGLMTDEQRRARTERNLDRLRHTEPARRGARRWTATDAL